MGRWGEGLYESDSALNYVSDIENQLLREITFWISPEQVTHDTRWLTQVITVVEIILLFEKNKVGISATYLMDMEPAVKRWRDTFFSVWDAEWDDLSYIAERSSPFRTYKERLQHREAMIKHFDRLEESAAYWTDIESEDLPPFNPKKLPYFTRRGHKDVEIPVCSYLVGQISETLIHSIVYYLSEKAGRYSASFSDIECVSVSVDIINHLCEAYTGSHRVSKATATNWRDNTISLWEGYHEGLESQGKDSPLYKNMIAVFDRFIALADDDDMWAI